MMILLAVIVELQAKSEWGQAPDFILATLFVLAFALDFWELLPIIISTAWVLNWQPVIGQELIYLIFLPIAVFLLKRVLPWQPWLGVAVYALGGVVCFYLLSGLPIWRLAAPGFIFLDAVAVLLWSWAMFALLHFFTHRTRIQNLPS